MKSVQLLLKKLYLSFLETQTKLANLPNLPKFVKIKNHLNVSKFKILFYFEIS